jgi:endogenous inhibitor of DNA gyrase (YacG/DUF329 family)
MLPEQRKCLMCGKIVGGRRRLYCTNRCSNRANWVKQYGLTPEDYRLLLGDGNCPICGRKMRKVNVDHDHKTGQVRGLVCGTCNKRVLTSVTKPEQAEGLLKYLLTPPSTLLSGAARVVTITITNRDKNPRRRFR